MYYLIEHNRKTKCTTCEEFKHYNDAQLVCAQKERTLQQEIEVVIFEARCLDDLQKTHSRYFIKNGYIDNELTAINMIRLAVKHMIKV